ncbi:MAG: polysaccharide pyruvyl transferase family protein [Fibrobacter sp.]|uniref:polysaccharide pyruvyl transferase family protein n=1 Tax=Fibrobacter sp. TaxID=35828 RepID=UPI0025B827F2|nr:polysaccharide pyruvyl transferase family protein [Fibrobacter sp.]MBQ9224893.1 polysaccharide pyruvyl transferase family protein [Fibrobacter sp.]
MQYKLLSIESRDVINIGDYVQALAASLFLPQVDGFVDREKLDQYQGETCKVIMNGWFMHHPEHWPPSPQIIPLFIALHLNSSVQQQMLSKEGCDYLRKYAPIGCRDIYTMQLLQKNDIDSYFSGCLTLTLGKKYSCSQKGDKVYFVDPYIDLAQTPKNLVKGIITILRAPMICLKIRKRMDSRRGIKQLLKAAAFYRTYSKFFSVGVMNSAEFITQESSHYKNDFGTDAERLSEAERLVKAYASAKLVVTSRIHCALPCLGLNTPVVFTQKESLDETTSCRYGGIKELFNGIDFNGYEGKPNFRYDGYYIDSQIPSNPEKYKELIPRISSVIEKFISCKNNH